MVCIFPHRHLVKIRKISYHIMLTQKSYVPYELHRYLLRAIYDHNEYSVNTSYQISAYQAVLKMRCLLTRETMVIISPAAYFGVLNEPSIYPLLMILQWSV